MQKQAPATRPAARLSGERSVGSVTPPQAGSALVFAAVLTLALLAAYWNSFRVPFLLDDEVTILRNPAVLSLGESWKPPVRSGMTSAGRPLVNVSLALDHHFAGASVLRYHVTNFLLHAVASIVLFGLVRRTLLIARRVNMAGGLGATTFAGLVAALWALHPLQTGAVTYIVQRAEVLAGLFTYLALYCFARHVCDPDRRSGGRGWLLAAWLSTLAGMGSKEVCAAIPVLVMTFDRVLVLRSFSEVWHRRRRFHLAMAATWVPLAALVWAGGGRDGTVGFGGDLAWWPYLQTQAWAIVHYLRLALWPIGLVFDYGVFIQARPEVFVFCAVLIGALLAVVVVALKRRPEIGWWGGLFFVVLAPTSSVVPVVTQTVAEHRMYVPLSAVVVVVVFGLARLADRLGRVATLALGIVLAGALAVLTHQRNAMFATDLILWGDTVAKRPENSRAHLNLGLALVRAGRHDEALLRLERAAELDPADSRTLGAIGQVHLRAGRIETSVNVLRAALARDPTSSYVRANLGNALLEAGQAAEAIEIFRAVWKAEPHLADVGYNLANALRQAGRTDEALDQYARVLDRHPRDLPARVNHAAVLRELGRLEDALIQCDEGLRFHPDSVELHTHRGVTLAMRGRRDDAVGAFLRAVELAPRAYEVRMNAAMALVESGRFNEALDHFEAVSKSREPSADFCHLYGVALAQAGRQVEAREWMRRALVVEPAHRPARDALRALDNGGAPDSGSRH